MTHALDDAVALERTGADSFTGRTTAPYANMVGPYGGITAAVLQNAVLQHPDLLGDPLALTVNFAAAVADGQFDLTARAVRTNRSTQHWTIELAQEGQVAATATAVTATHREGWTDTEAVMPEVPEPHEVRLGDKPPMAWPNRYEMRFLQGPVLGTGAPGSSSQTTLWVRDDPPRPLDFVSLTAFCDVFFPRVFVRRARQMPIGTVSMTAYFHATAEELTRHGDDYLLGSVRGSAFQRGFYDHVGHLWGRDGTLLATTHQIVYYKG